MKDKILAAIKAKFPKVNLSKTRLDAIVAKIETKVSDDETLIDAQIDEFNNFNPFTEIAKNDDVIRNYEAKLKSTGKYKENVIDLEVTPDDTPAWAKSLIEQNKVLSEGLAAIQGEKKTATIRSKVAVDLKEIPASYWGKRQMPEKDEDLGTFVEDVKADYSAFTQELANNGLKNIPAPGSGVQPSAKGVSPEIKAFAEKTVKSAIATK